ncbi:MAG: nucleotidyltransferase family protein [Desulfuromonadales bacterium]|nr:nucleotidyltransferase family protein [Desulfuromonadales bacterium]
MKIDFCPPMATPGELRRAESVLESLVPEEQWAVYATVLRQALDLGLRFAVGGGLAYSLYSECQRNTKDLDVFILPDDHQPFLDLMALNGFTEYTAVPYDPTWSYRGHRQDYILDVLWRMLNNRAVFDDAWVSRGWQLNIRGVPVKLIPPEELIWSKLYIIYRERCDWPDILSILHARGAQLDWEHLLARTGDDAPLLGSVLTLFRWLCPGRAATFPHWIWKRLGLSETAPVGPDVDRSRADLIHGGSWFPQ